MQDDHKFWPTQPVEHNPTAAPRQIIEVQKEQVPKKSLPTPPFLKFEVVDQFQPQQIDELTQFLADNYVGDSKNRCRFGYSKEFLTWWLTSQPNNISVGLRVVKADNLSDEHKKIVENLKNGELVGYISGIPMNYTYKELTSMGQSVDFLCVHHQLRQQNLAPLLIQEITRRSYKQGIYTAVFTAAFTAKQEKPIIPPVLITQYYHRLLDPVKLMQCEFCRKPQAMSERDYIQHYKLPYTNSQQVKCVRKMVKEDQEACWKLLEAYQTKNFKIQQHYPQALFNKMFRNVDNVIQCFVYEKDKEILGFASFYIVDTQMLAPEIQKLHKYIRNGYFFQYAVKADQKEIDEVALMTIMIHEMKKQKVDVATCLNIGKNVDIIQKLQMDGGDGKLSYHTFNVDWGTDIKCEELGIVLV